MNRQVLLVTLEHIHTSGFTSNVESFTISTITCYSAVPCTSIFSSVIDNLFEKYINVLKPLKKVKNFILNPCQSDR